MRTPVVVFDEVKIGGRWIRGPVIANHLRHIDCEALLFGLEPSAPMRGVTSKIVIDATRQWPEEGGPAEYPELSRALLAEHAPDIFARVDRNWGSTIVAP